MTCPKGYQSVKFVSSLLPHVSKEVKNMACNMIVCPHHECASTCWNTYTKCNVDKLETMQRRAARFVLNFYDCRPSTHLSGNILKYLQWDSLQHCRAVADLCMFYKLRNNIATIPVPPILFPSVSIFVITTFSLFTLMLLNTIF